MITAKEHVLFTTPALLNYVRQRSIRILYRTGGWGLTYMRRLIRQAPKRDRGLRTVEVDGKEYYVPFGGRVYDAKTGRPARQSQADRARPLAIAKSRGHGAGRPPRSRTGLLKNKMAFAVDEQRLIVTVGTQTLPNQPQLVGAVSVPQLLDQGGGEFIAGFLAVFAPRPFVQQAAGATAQQMLKFLRRR